MTSAPQPIRRHVTSLAVGALPAPPGLLTPVRSAGAGPGWRPEPESSMDGIPTPDRMNSPLAPDDPDARLDVRQARLRPEFAAEYPGIDADVWYPAKMLADYHRAWLARRPHPAGDGRERVLDPEHFEFRGGRPHGGPWTPGVSGDRRER